MAGYQPGTTDDEPVGDVGWLSTPAQLLYSVRPTRHGPNADTKIRSLTRIAFGFHSPKPLNTLALLALGSHPPHNSQAETDPRIEQKSHIWAATRCWAWVASGALGGGGAGSVCDEADQVSGRLQRRFV